MGRDGKWLREQDVDPDFGFVVFEVTDPTTGQVWVRWSPPITFSWAELARHLYYGVYYRIPPCCIANFCWTYLVRGRLPAEEYRKRGGVAIASTGYVPCRIHEWVWRRRGPTGSARGKGW